MKRIFVTLALAVAFTISAAAQASVGAGYVNDRVNSVEGKASVTGTGFASLNGFYVQASYGFRINHSFTIAPGISYTRAGTSENGCTYIAGGQYGSRISLRKQSIDIPVAFTYKFRTCAQVKPFFYAAPVFSFGISYNLKETTFGGAPRIFEKDWQFYKSEAGLARIGSLNLLADFGAGIIIAQKVKLSAGISLGLLDCGSNSLVDNFATSVRNNRFHVGVAYIF